MPNKPKILVVDDHPLVRKGIVSSLENDEWTICGEASNGKEAVEEFLRLKPDLVLTDISMPVMNGVEAAKQIRILSPSAKIVMFSMHDSAQLQDQARAAGANAYLTKTASSEELHRVIRQVLEHGN